MLQKILFFINRKYGFSFVANDITSKGLISFAKRFNTTFEGKMFSSTGDQYKKEEGDNRRWYFPGLRDVDLEKLHPEPTSSDNSKV